MSFNNTTDQFACDRKERDNLWMCHCERSAAISTLSIFLRVTDGNVTIS